MPRSLLCAMALTFALAFPAAAEPKTIELEIGGKVALGDLVVPEGNSLSDGVLLITHGTLAHKDMEIVEALQMALAERGVATLAHSLTLGLDRREGMYDCKVPHNHAHEDAVDEIGAWITWLVQNGAGKVSVLGHSRGGNQVAAAVAEKGGPEKGGPEKVVLLAPALTLSGKVAADTLKQRFQVDISPALRTAAELTAEGKDGAMLDVPAFVFCQGGKASARAVVSYYGEDMRRNALINIARLQQPVLVIAGSKDTLVADVPQRIQPIADGKKVRFAMVEGADHMFLEFYAEDAADLIAAFVKE